MKSYRIVIEYSTTNYKQGHPSNWDWHDLLASNPDEAISLINVEAIPTPEGHLEDLADA